MKTRKCIPIRIKDKIRKLNKLQNECRDITDEIHDWFEEQNFNTELLYANAETETSENQIEAMAYISNAEVSQNDIEDIIQQIEEFYINYK